MTLRFSCFSVAGEHVEAAEGALFVCDAPGMEASLAACDGVVLPVQGEARAAALLEADAKRVFLGEAALADCGVVERLADRFGAERIGVAISAKRMEGSWSFDKVSNADFKVVAPSVCEPCWEILRADGTRSGTRVHWWLSEMMKRGAAAALVRVDIRDDADLNLCAGLVEDLGERLWLGPLEQAEPSLGEWTTYGKLERILLPPALYARRGELLPLAGDGSDTQATPNMEAV